VNVINVYSLYKRRTLVSRESAGALRDVIFEAVSDSPVALDLSGIRAITPAFIDQMLLIVEESLGEDSDRLDVLLLNPPPGMDSKLQPIGRAHHLSVAEEAKGNWVIRGTPSDSESKSLRR
jgi:hypothetical protein